MKQFNLLEGKNERDLVLERLALDPSKADWFKEAKQVLFRVAKNYPTFTVDDIWAQGLRPAPGDSRALGPVLLAARGAKIIEATAAFRPSTIVAHHAGPKRIWRSLICEAT